MIVREHPSARELFLVVHGSVVPRILPNIFAALAWASLLLIADRWLFDVPHISIAALGIFGLSLSLFLGFRNNAAYDRWWEARRIWGKMVSDVRSFAQEMQIFGVPDADRAVILTHILAFHHLHRAQLRGDDVTQVVTDWVGPADAPALLKADGPDVALRAISARLAQLAAEGTIDGFGQRALAERLGCFALAQAANERLLTTPLPFVYSLLVRRTTYLYCFLLPFGLIDSAGLFEPLVAAAAAYVFFGLSEVTHELEQPFVDQPNGIPLSAMCRVMEISVCNALGRPAPPRLTPVNHVLR